MGERKIEDPVSAFQLFSVSAFQRFSFSAFSPSMSDCPILDQQGWNSLEIDQVASQNRHIPSQRDGRNSQVHRADADSLPSQVIEDARRQTIERQDLGRREIGEDLIEPRIRSRRRNQTARAEKSGETMPHIADWIPAARCPNGRCPKCTSGFQTIGLPDLSAKPEYLLEVGIVFERAGNAVDPVLLRTQAVDLGLQLCQVLLHVRHSFFKG